MRARSVSLRRTPLGLNLAAAEPRLPAAGAGVLPGKLEDDGAAMISGVDPDDIVMTGTGAGPAPGVAVAASGACTASREAAPAAAVAAPRAVPPRPRPRPLVVDLGGIGQPTGRVAPWIGDLAMGMESWMAESGRAKKVALHFLTAPLPIPLTLQQGCLQWWGT